jgi:hypothetical protein
MPIGWLVLVKKALEITRKNQVLKYEGLGFMFNLLILQKLNFWELQCQCKEKI